MNTRIILDKRASSHEELCCILIEKAEKRNNRHCTWWFHRFEQWLLHPNIQYHFSLYKKEIVEQVDSNQNLETRLFDYIWARIPPNQYMAGYERSHSDHVIKAEAFNEDNHYLCAESYLKGVTI